MTARAWYSFFRPLTLRSVGLQDKRSRLRLPQIGVPGVPLLLVVGIYVEVTSHPQRPCSQVEASPASAGVGTTQRHPKHRICGTPKRPMLITQSPVHSPVVGPDFWRLPCMKAGQDQHYNHVRGCRKVEAAPLGQGGRGGVILLGTTSPPNRQVLPTHHYASTKTPPSILQEKPLYSSSKEDSPPLYSRKD